MTRYSITPITAALELRAHRYLGGSNLYQPATQEAGGGLVGLFF